MPNIFQASCRAGRDRLVYQPNADRALRSPIPFIVGLGCSVRQAAEYLGTSKTQVDSMIHHYPQEFEQDGMRKWSCQEILDCKTIPSYPVGAKVAVCSDNGNAIMVGPKGLLSLTVPSLLRLSLLIDTPEAHALARRLQALNTGN